MLKYLYLVLPLCLCISCNSNSGADRNVLLGKIDSLNIKNYTSAIEAQSINVDEVRFCINKSEELGYSLGQSKAFTVWATQFENKGKRDSALLYHLKALDLRRKKRDTSLIASSCRNIAKLYFQLNSFKQQHRYLNEAFQILEQSKDTLMKIKVQMELGSCYYELDNTDSSKLFFASSMKWANAFSNEEQRILTMENYGNILLTQGEHDSALHYYKPCIAYYSKHKMVTHLTTLENNLGIVFSQKGKDDSALVYFFRSYNNCKKYQLGRPLVNSLVNIVGEYENKGNYETANYYLSELLDFKDSLYKGSLESKIANIEKDFTVKLKSEENAKLKSEVKRKNTLRNAAVLTALLLALLGLYQYRSFKQKRRILEKEKRIQENEIDQLLKEKEVKNLDAIIEGREAEQQRIGRDLHDRLGSILSTVKMHFSAIDEKIDSLKIENKIQYEKANSLLDEAVSEVRKIAHDLSSGVLVKQGLKAAILDLKSTIESSGKMKLNFFEAGEFQAPSLEYEITLYRVIQETISNILKHANATKVDIHLTQQDEQVTLIVEDNGKGFDVNNLQQFGIGLANVKQRVAHLGGVLTIDSSPGKGCSIIVEILNPEKHG